MTYTRVSTETSYGWDEQIAMSYGADGDSIQEVLLATIPLASGVKTASLQEDKDGTDCWVMLSSKRIIGVDVKRRDTDPVEAFHEDDLALELWSMLDEEVVGWTLDERKQSDYILWWWVPTRRWCLVPFPMLRAVFAEHRDEWSQLYRHAVQRTHRGAVTWRSECIFVPRVVVWRAIYERFGGGSVA